MSRRRLTHILRAAWPGCRGREIHQLVHKMSAQLDQLQADVARLTQAVTDTQQRVTAAQALLQQTIDDLKAHPAAEDLSGVIAGVEAAVDAMGKIDPAAPAAAPDAPPVA